MVDSIEQDERLLWQDLSRDTRELLSGKLDGLFGVARDDAAFEALADDKQQALLLLLERLRSKKLWPAVRRISNVYGLGGVGIDFFAWPFIESTLSCHCDFTRWFAKRKGVSGGFYEKGPQQVVLHFLYQSGETRQWHVHFDLYNPLYSPANTLRHVRLEHLNKTKPDWRKIKKALANQK